MRNPSILISGPRLPLGTAGLADLAAVATAVLLAERALLPLRAEYLRPPAEVAGEDGHVAAPGESEGPVHEAHLVELREPRLAEALEPGGVDEVGHRDAGDGIVVRLDRIADLVGVEAMREAARR